MDSPSTSTTLCASFDFAARSPQVVTQGNILNLKRAEEHPAFNKAVDIRTGYKTRSMLVIPIRGSDSIGVDAVKEGRSILAATAPIGGSRRHDLVDVEGMA